jgi:uroporphyrinogen decarboxylase
MDRKRIKEEFGDRLTFWGGTVDPQGTLPFGTPEEVRAEARGAIWDLAPGGGYIYNSIHNIQPGVPTENVLAYFEVIGEHGSYPIG